MKNLILSLLISTFLYSNLAIANSISKEFNPIKTKERLLLTIKKVEKAITILNPKINKKKATRLATLVSIESKKNKIDPRVILAILNTESSFNQNAINKNNNGTKDISIAQINSKAWNPIDFERRTGSSLDLKRLEQDEAYAISRMSLILSHLKENFSKSDKWWFARYHSSTPEYKDAYLKKLVQNFKLLKPFGKNLLKDMPEIHHIKKLKQFSPINNSIAMTKIGETKND